MKPPSQASPASWPSFADALERTAFRRFVGGPVRRARVGQLAVLRLGAQLTLPYPHLFPHLMPKYRPFARRCELARVALRAALAKCATEAAG